MDIIQEVDDLEAKVKAILDTPTMTKNERNGRLLEVWGKLKNLQSSFGR